MNYNLVHNEAYFITSRSHDRKYLNIKPSFLPRAAVFFPDFSITCLRMSGNEITVNGFLRDAWNGGKVSC